MLHFTDKKVGNLSKPLIDYNPHYIVKKGEAGCQIYSRRFCMFVYLDRPVTNNGCPHDWVINEKCSPWSFLNDIVSNGPVEVFFLGFFSSTHCLSASICIFNFIYLCYKSLNNITMPVFLSSVIVWEFHVLFVFQKWDFPAKFESSVNSDFHSKHDCTLGDALGLH